MSTEPWCDFNDMPKAGCEHCNPGNNGPKPELSNYKLAEYFTDCPGCMAPIRIGDTIGVTSDGDWYHYGCGS